MEYSLGLTQDAGERGEGFFHPFPLRSCAKARDDAAQNVGTDLCIGYQVKCWRLTWEGRCIRLVLTTVFRWSLLARGKVHAWNEVMHYCHTVQYCRSARELSELLGQFINSFSGNYTQCLIFKCLFGSFALRKCTQPSHGAHTFQIIKHLPSSNSEHSTGCLSNAVLAGALLVAFVGNRKLLSN